MQKNKTLVLIDGSSYLYRAFHAMPNLHSSNDVPTGALHGFINMLNALDKEIEADYGVCVFDASGPTFRDALYDQYKANRSAMPDDLRQQIQPIHDVTQLLGWHLLNVPEVEADDVIGTLAKQAASMDMQVLISSGDKDLAQLVDSHITILDTMSGKRRDIAGVLAEFGVAPQNMIDYQTLVGDSVDNIPGVAKVGPKTAAKWLHEYGSLENLLAAADSIKGTAGQNLRDAKDWLPTARQLVTIKTDVAQLPSMTELKRQPAKTEKLIQFCRQYGLNSLLKKIQQKDSPQTHLADTNAVSTSLANQQTSNGFHGTPQYQTILLWQDLEHYLAILEKAELVAIDTETTSLDQMRAQLVGISFSTSPGQACYVPLSHDYAGAPDQLPLEQVLAKLKPWLENPQHAKLGQHIKYDRHIFANHGIHVQGYQHDTMLQSYVLEVNQRHSLESLALRHTQRAGTSYEELCGKGAAQISFSQIDIDKASHYACEDADFTFDVHSVLSPQIETDSKLREIYALEIDTSEVLFRMEREGVKIDAKALAFQSHELGARILTVEQEAYALAGQEFNLSSPKQLAEIFFDKLNMPVIKKTAKGARSTNEEVLETLALDYPLPARLLEHRSLAKLKSTYTDKLAQLTLPRTGRVHTHYAQAVAITGRLSSIEPNLQNIPIRTAEGRRVREAFIAEPQHCIASADYSQIELRIMAHLSDDAALLQAFSEGTDIHKATAAEVFGLTLEEVSSEQRRFAKVINFGLIYGMSAFGLAKTLGIDNTAARNYIDRYFERYPGVRCYMEDTKALAKQQGYVETVFGRRLYLPEINSENGQRRAAAERAAINAPMQGTAADLIKKSMVAVQALLDQKRPNIRMMMQVHDELVFEVPIQDVSWLQEYIPTTMANVAQLKVPLLAELGVGQNWQEAH